MLSVILSFIILSVAMLTAICVEYYI